MRNGGRVVLAALTLYVRIKICVATIPSLIAHSQSLLQCRRLLILWSSQLTQLAVDRVDVSGEFEVSRSGLSSRVTLGVGLRPLACRDCGFECHQSNRNTRMLGV